MLDETPVHAQPQQTAARLELKAVPDIFLHFGGARGDLGHGVAEIPGEEVARLPAGAVREPERELGVPREPIAPVEVGKHDSAMTAPRGAELELEHEIVVR